MTNCEKRELHTTANPTLYARLLKRYRADIDLIKSRYSPYHADANARHTYKRTRK